MYSNSFSKLRANNDPGLSQLLIPSPASSFVPELLDIYNYEKRSDEAISFSIPRLLRSDQQLRYYRIPAARSPVRTEQEPALS